jgi:hypothetical protein
VPSEVRTNAPLRVPASTRTPLTSYSLQLTAPPGYAGGGRARFLLTLPIAAKHTYHDPLTVRRTAAAFWD